ncbi:hypothetical protein N657DRAFT_635886 [Parathielavia appendiculata]|uniref:Uncharacterized protein n=1 Tax=Parathielavia appendiculata TaxID=2587402 RepID=A0AAN6TV50_9PEZI|nr:hypothetical protein N657DRAFT_635886 [Parathielavia appendiculata]
MPDFEKRAARWTWLYKALCNKAIAEWFLSDLTKSHVHHVDMWKLWKPEKLAAVLNQQVVIISGLDARRPEIEMRGQGARERNVTGTTATMSTETTTTASQPPPSWKHYPLRVLPSWYLAKNDNSEDQHWTPNTFVDPGFQENDTMSDIYLY